MATGCPAAPAPDAEGFVLGEPIDDVRRPKGQQPLAERARRHAAPDTRAGQSRQDKRPRSSVRAGRIRLRLRRVREDAGRDNTRKLHESRMLYLRAEVGKIRVKPCVQARGSSMPARETAR
jgi:hypothetical protein